MLYSSSQSNFSTLEEAFLSYLSKRCPDQTFSGVEKMAMQLHCSRRQLQRVLKKLLEKGTAHEAIQRLLPPSLNI